jgi:hypothetical protein
VHRLVCHGPSESAKAERKAALFPAPVYETDGRLAAETQDLAATRVLIICAQFLAQGKLAM